MEKDFIGELMGTFILTFFGCSSVAVAVLFGEYNSIFQIGIVWGLAVTLAIFLTRNICCAHLNPAVSVAMVVCGRMNVKKLPSYLGAQFCGAILAGLMLYLLFSPSIEQYEMAHNIVRGAKESVDTARMFGEFYPNPGDATSVVSLPHAMLAEGFGTFLLALFIFGLTEDCNVGRPSSDLQPLFIGLTVSSIIFFIAPLTQAGLNPARDFGPRIVAYIFGWKENALPDAVGGWFWVYILAPIIGSSTAALFFKYVLEPINNKKNNQCGCK
ncbi:MAG: MIP/aquaporin family protein [Prevotellaceae bacterium]|nr:MIP/aquaporin family protein [Prevotellaceae bacterium]